ncbi:hypothetical protein J132_05864 [Termitomyces sp. J132]|nr:hypothetical protein J132_05864 [Termitomyces sp. J132]
MSSSFGFYMIFAACLAALFSVLTLAAPAPALEKRDHSGKVSAIPAYSEISSCWPHSQAVWFNVGLGSCGQTNVDSDYIVALNPKTYAGGAHCGKKIRITDKATGVSAIATVRDTCPGCGTGDLGTYMSPSLFSHFESLDKGTFKVEWSFL